MIFDLKSTIVINSQTEWDNTIGDDNNLTAAVFFSEKSPPCEQMFSILNELALPHENCQLAAVDVYKNSFIACRYRISLVPTLIIFRGQHKVGEVFGLQDKFEIARVLKNVIG